MFDHARRTHAAIPHVELRRAPQSTGTRVTGECQIVTASTTSTIKCCWLAAACKLCRPCHDAFCYSIVGNWDAFRKQPRCRSCRCAAQLSALLKGNWEYIRFPKRSDIDAASRFYLGQSGTRKETNSRSLIPTCVKVSVRRLLAIAEGRVSSDWIFLDRKASSHRRNHHHNAPDYTAT